MTKTRSEASEMITSGHIPSAVWYLAWPTVVNTLIQTAYNIINRLFLGRLGDQAETALAAAGIAGVGLMIQFGVMFGISAGTSALVSRFLGAEEYDNADDAARQSLILSVIGGILSMIALGLLATPAVRLFGAKPDVVPLAADYLFTVAMFSIPVFVYVIVTSALRAAGDVKSLLYVGAVIIGLNVLLDWLLIFGFTIHPSFFPAIRVHVAPMGIHGAALATGISRAVGMVLILWFMSRSVLKRSLTRIRPHLQWFGRILNIGWPAALQALLFSTGLGAYLWILGQLPNATAAQAAITIALAIESMCFMPGVAYSIAATPLVGQNLGAGKVKRAEHCAWVATAQAAIIMTIVAVVLFVFAEQLGLIFLSRASEASKAAVLPLIVSYLKINAVCEPFLAVGMVLAGGLQGAGDTRMPTVIEFIVNWPARLALAWLLAVTLGYGAVGMWISLCATTILYGFLIAGWFKWGTWRTQKV